MSSIRIITCFVLLCQCQLALALSFSFIPDEELASYDKSVSGSIATDLPDFPMLSADQGNIQSVRDVLVNLYTLTGHAEGGHVSEPLKMLSLSKFANDFVMNFF